MVGRMVAAEAEQIEVASTATGADAASDSDSTPNRTCGGDESVINTRGAECSGPDAQGAVPQAAGSGLP